MKADEFDSIIFDCDGVLIDVTKSYDTTINETISLRVKGDSRHYCRYTTN